MGTNYYMTWRTVEAEPMPLADALRGGLIPEDGSAEVMVYRVESRHVAKTSWGWRPLFQRSSGDGGMAGIRSVGDIRELYAAGGCSIEDEYGDECSWEDFERLVIGWADHQKRLMAERGEEPREPRSHFGIDELGVYVDPEGYEFATFSFS